MAKAPLRVLMVARHYWPHLSSDVASRTIRLADALARSGIDVELLTPRYASSWPDQICHREIVVHRPAAAPRSEWSMGRYLRHLESWLRQHAAQYDVIYSATMREEAALVVDAARRANACSVLHHSGTGSEADTSYVMPPRHRRKTLLALQSADAIVVSRASTHQKLLGTGLDPDRVHRVTIGITSGPGPGGRDPVSRVRSRQFLADVNGDLSTHRDTLVVLAVGSLSESSGLMSLAHAVPDLVNRWPDLRFWMIGDGPLRNDLHRYFKHQGVRQNIAMPGTFVDLTDILAAADVYVQPSGNDSLDDFLPQVIAAPLPLVMADVGDLRAVVSHDDDCVNWCRESDPLSLRQAIQRVLIDLSPAQLAAERLRRELLRHSPYSETIDGFLNLFSRLAGKTIPSPNLPHTESAARRPLPGVSGRGERLA